MPCIVYKRFQIVKLMFTVFTFFISKVFKMSKLYKSGSLKRKQRKHKL